MKKILVPTDFSPVADNAMQYAVEIAAIFESELYLYHAYSFDRFNYDLNYPEDEQPYAKEVKRKMHLTELKFKKKIVQNGLFFRSIVEKGSILSLFQSKVKEHGISMIVMGTKGASGLEKVVFGSIAATALEMAKVPVLVIPPGHTFHTPKHIVLAIDHKGSTGEVLSPLRKLALKFGAKVTLLNVNTNSGKQKYREVGISGLDGVATTYQGVPMSKSVNETINEFTGKEDCDLLCMVRRDRGFFGSFFKKSTTKEQVYNSRVPLLVLPEK
jgi:nucleotide-binding universal stress UspA family protein